MWGFIITSVIDVLKLVVKKWHCFPQRHFNPNTNRVNGKSVYSTETANCAATALPAAWWLYLFKYSSVEYVYSLQRLPFKHLTSLTLPSASSKKTSITHSGLLIV